MQELLDEANPERILLGLITPQIGDDFIKKADDKAFARAICALDPEHFIVPFRTVFRYLKPSLETQPKYRAVKSLEERMASFINILDCLVTQRQESGHKLGLDIYRHLLRCAAAAGVGSLARNVFRSIMPEEGIGPDLDCYNYFMESLAWNDAYSRHERYHSRIVTHNMMRRSSAIRPHGFEGHGVAAPDNRKNQESIRLETLGIFDEMVCRGHIGNEATFCNVMVAMGREGDLGSVKSILKSVWNIDVGALDKCDEEDLECPIAYGEGLPLRPSARLLFTVVHVFGANNEVALGGMLLDHISRNYNLEIPEYIWTHLLEWTYVLSIQHGKDDVESGLGEGRIARRAVYSVYHVFHSAPYNVKPKVVDLIFRVKASDEGRKLYRALRDLRQCMELLEEERKGLSELHDQLLKWIKGWNYHVLFSDGLPAADFLDLKSRYIMASLQLECHIQLISIAVRNTFKKNSWTAGDMGTDWSYRKIPDMIAEWGAWLPNIVPYYLPTGHVRMLGRDSRHSAMKAGNDMQTTRTGSHRQLLDTYSPQRLRHAIDFLRRSGPYDMVAKFQAEADNDQSGLLDDWVLRYEHGLRRARMKDRQVATSVMTMPAADHLSHSWTAWGGTVKKKSPSIQDGAWWEMDGIIAEAVDVENGDHLDSNSDSDTTVS